MKSRYSSSLLLLVVEATQQSQRTTDVGMNRFRHGGKPYGSLETDLLASNWLTFLSLLLTRQVVADFASNATLW